MEKKKLFNYKVTKWDVLAVVALIIFVTLVSLPVWLDKGGCEVARAGYKCESFQTVLKENCDYWGSYDCDTDADISLVQVEWYIGNLCKLENDYHDTGLDCSNLKSACNQVTGEQTCPFGV